MSARKKTSKKRSKTKTIASSRTTSKKKRAAGKKQSPGKHLSKKKAPQKKAGKKNARTAAPVRNRGRAPGGTFSQQGRAGQSGDLQGLSGRPGADSESVEELLEEGNAFEAGAVSGVEHADDFEEQEVHTHEVPEDDVPEEYLDKDS